MLDIGNTDDIELIELKKISSDKISPEHRMSVERMKIKNGFFVYTGLE